MTETPLQRLDAFELLRLGKTAITVGGLGVALVIIVTAMLAARLTAGGLRRLRARAVTSATSLYIIEKLVTYGLVVIGIVAGLSTMGLDLTSLAVFAGALGVGVGLGLQSMVKNFAAGLSLVFERLVGVGDFVELENGMRGVVHEIGPRATRIRTNDSTDILVPNAMLVDGLVVNWTLRHQTRRIRIPFVTAFGVDKDKVRQAVLGAARSVAFTLPDDATRRSQVWLTGYGDSSLKFELLVWPTLEAVKRPAAMQAAYTWAIDDALRAAGIEIPFPQREVRLHGPDGAAEGASGPPRPGRTRRAAGGSRNDAADDLARDDPEEPPTPAS